MWNVNIKASGIQIQLLILQCICWKNCVIKKNSYYIEYSRYIPKKLMEYCKHGSTWYRTLGLGYKKETVKRKVLLWALDDKQRKILSPIFIEIIFFQVDEYFIVFGEFVKLWIRITFFFILG